MCFGEENGSQMRRLPLSALIIFGVRALGADWLTDGGDTKRNNWQKDEKLLTMSNVVLTPHLGSAVAELREAMAHIVVDNIVAVLEGRKPPNCWNTEIYTSQNRAHR